MSGSTCCVFDFTLGCEFCNLETLKTHLKNFCKKWTFQKEKGETTGYLHWQGRVSLKTKAKLSTLINKWPIKETHWSCTSSQNMGNDFYVTKIETQIEGPWTDKDKEPIYIPRQVREIKEFRPFQKQIIDSFDLWEPRQIFLIYDPKGNRGKTIVSTYLGVNGIAHTIPMINDYKDIMQMVCDMDPAKGYILDLPRSLKKDKMYNIYGAIETIKSGYAFDTRYKFTKKYFDCPIIWVFTNDIPDANYLSQDRWRFFKINEKDELEAFDPYSVNLSGFLQPTPTPTHITPVQNNHIYGTIGIPQSVPHPAPYLTTIAVIPNQN